ncbi:MAG: hypothetical protein KDD33_07750 [Bdellovibrionales bacterium]|nr:hypothetical protein [Bdellovibrionales bacterium]
MKYLIVILFLVFQSQVGLAKSAKNRKPAKSNANLFECDINLSPQQKYKISIDKSGRASLSVKANRKTYKCNLVVEKYDNRQNLQSPNILKIYTKRYNHNCKPMLPAVFDNGIVQNLDIEVTRASSKKSNARVFLFSRLHEVNCGKTHLNIYGLRKVIKDFQTNELQNDGKQRSLQSAVGAREEKSLPGIKKLIESHNRRHPIRRSRSGAR